MALMFNMVLCAIALVTMANAAFITNMITLTFALSTVAQAGFFANTVTLAIALATVTTAKPVNFTYLGFETREDECDKALVCYTVTYDNGAVDRQGFFRGCVKGTRPLSDAEFTLSLYVVPDPTTPVFTAVLTELASGLALYASMDWSHDGDLPKWFSTYPKARTVYGHSHFGFDWNPGPYKNPTCLD